MGVINYGFEILNHTYPPLDTEMKLEIQACKPIYVGRKNYCLTIDEAKFDHKYEIRR